MLDVKAFDATAFAAALDRPPRNKALVALNPRVRYLADYLKEIQARTMVIEDGYIDRNFLEDHAAYYVRCHEDYERKCRRIHFFAAAFTREQFVAAAVGTTGNIEPTVGRYLGFIVAKPLPQSFIGRTCLQPYPAMKAGGERRYEALATHHVHLLGRQFTVESMPFQEQDSVVAACATTALWSALQTVGPLFGKYAPTPAEITAQAAGYPMKFGRDFPSSGLAIYQMMQAIVGYGFEPEAREMEAGRSDYIRRWGTTPAGYLAELVHAYSSAGLPVILGHKLSCPTCKWTGLHAATIAGYSLKTPHGRPRHKAIDEFYAHDDQSGPFTRLKMGSNPAELDTGFPHEHAGTKAIPWVVIVPAYPKIRITYEEARTESQRMAAWLAALNLPMETETTLEHASDVHERIRTASYLPAAVKARIVDESPPRFLWSSVWYQGTNPIIEVLMDATNVRPSFFCHRVIIHDEALGRDVAAKSAQLDFTARFFNSPYADKWLAKIREAGQDWALSPPVAAVAATIPP